MTLPEPDVCIRMSKLHALIGSAATGEAENAREKLVRLLAEHRCSWNDLPEILDHVRRTGSAATATTVPATGGPWGDPFHTPDGTAYVDIHVDGHRETWPVRSPGFRRHVRYQFFKQTEASASDALIRDIVGQLEAEAQFKGPQRQVHLRVGQHRGRIYVDLADHQWRIVEVTPDGWQIVTDAPVRFRREPGMLALPVPQKGRDVNELASFLNVGESDFILIVSWLLAALRGAGPYPVLAICGEHGSSKSTLTKMLRALIDPDVAPIRSLPRSEQDLFVSANDNFMLPFDNISSLPPSLSDALCRLATGGAFASRRFFKNTGEIAIQAVRPVMLNGISHVIERADLADRTIFVALEPIADGRRRPEAEILAAFERTRPGIFGALLDAAARGLRELPHTKPTELTRMADFDLWATACEPALWPAGSFRRAYAVNRSAAVENSIEADLVATTIRKIFGERHEWQGTAGDLLKLISSHADKVHRSTDRDWPKTERGLRSRLDRARPNLRRLGIEITHDRAKDRKRTRIITISNVVQAESPVNGEIRLRRRGDCHAGGDPDAKQPSEPSTSSGSGNGERPQRAATNAAAPGRSGRSGRSTKHAPH
jgi:hypothetical protein